MLLTSVGELPDAVCKLRTSPGVFDSEVASLREAISPLRMTGHKSLPMTRIATRNIFHPTHVVFLYQRRAQSILLTETLPIHDNRVRARWLLVAHVEHLIARAQIFLRVAVAVETPLHLQRRLLIHQRHLVYRPVAGIAADPLIDVNAVIEENKVWKLIDSGPLQRLAGAVAGAHWFEQLSVGPDLRVAVHASAGRRDAGKTGGFD